MDAYMPKQPSSPKPPPQVSQSALLRLAEALRPWQLIRSTMPLQYVTTFLMVAAWSSK